MAVRVLLVGMMGAGKTSVGRALGRRTGWIYHDNDEVLARMAGVDTATLLAERGEPGLREAESRALAAALAADPPVIAGVAAGAVTSAADRDLLRGDEAFVVYLYAPVEVLAGRVGSGAGRPWLDPDPVTALRRLYDGREPLYREVADLVVDTTRGTPEEQAEQIVRALDAVRP